MSDQSPLEQDPQRRLRLAARTERPQAPAAKGGAPAPAPLGFVPQDISATVETHLLDYVKVVYKRRWMAMTAFLLVLGRTYAARRFTHDQATTAIVVSYYWHFVDVVWIGLFATIYLIR